MLNEGTGQVSHIYVFSDHQVFARKIVRIFGDITPSDAEAEGQTLSELCRPGFSMYVVEVLKHGWLPRHPSLYYIDMEYCLETLDNRISGVGLKRRQAKHCSTVTLTNGEWLRLELLSLLSMRRRTRIRCLSLTGSR